jgi:hypothetical protein
MANVIVNIDQSGRDVEVRDIHDLSGLVRRNIFFDGSDFALENRDVSYFIDVIRGVNDMTAFQ